MTRKIRLMPAALAGVLGMGSTIAWAAEPTTAELMDQIQALQNKVQQLENRQTTLSDAQVSATIQSVLNDAERRSQLFQMEGFTAGHDGKNFWLRSSDGNYSLSPRFQFQFRHTLNALDGGDTGVDDSIDKGFEVRRMKIEFVGNAITPALTYNFRWATENSGDSSGGGLTLENAYVQYELNDQWSIRAGQWKDNVFHEETVSSKYQLAADRSLVNEVIGGGVTDYIQGVAFMYATADSPFRGEVSAHDGANSDNTNFLDGTLATATPLAPGDSTFLENFGVSGRLEFAVNNNWEGYDDFSAMGNKDDLLVFGGGVDWTQSGDTNIYFHTIDVQWENTTGWGVYGAFLGQYVDSGDIDDEFYNWGGLVQVGYNFNENWEVFGRFSYLEFDEDLLASTDDEGDDYTEFTAGVNYFFKGHNAKITVDFGYLPDGSPVDALGIGVRASGDDQFYCRAQFQLLI